MRENMTEINLLGDALTMVAIISGAFAVLATIVHFLEKHQ
jgi:hypothetical protein